MKRRAILFGATALVLSGCSSLGLGSGDSKQDAGLSGFGYQVPERAVAMADLQNAQPCCSAFNQLRYIPTLVGKDYPTLIDSQSQVFNFATGVSYVAAYALPTQGGTFTLRIQAEAEDAIFKPSILMLDANFNPVRQISAEQFSYSPAKLMKPNTYDLYVSVDRSYRDKPDNEYFMVLFTTPDDLHGTSQVKSEEALFAERTSKVIPANPYLDIPHSPQGVVVVDLLSGVRDQQDVITATITGLFDGDDAEQLAGEPITAVAAQQIVAQSQRSPRAQQPVIAAQPLAQTIPDATPVASAAVVRSVASDTAMQPETEAFYNQLIQKKVNDKQIDKALKLVEEAERAGSRTAREYFINAVKQLN